MSHSKYVRQVIIPSPNYRDVSEHCRRFGINETDERNLKKLLGNHAPLHEIHANAPPKSPKYR
jgi:hypothetical protein